MVDLPSQPARPGLPGQPARPGLPGQPARPATPPAQAAPVAAPAASTAGVRVGPAADAPLDIDSLLTALVHAGGSDLHLSVGAPPFMRIDGDIAPMPGQPILVGDVLDRALMSILDEGQRKRFKDDLELDFAHTVAGIGRFRGNLLRQRRNTGAVFRIIPWEIKPLEALGMPTVLNNFANLPRGLVLVTGPTGSGKSTTLAALVDRANRTRNGHIITVEDPIEFLHDHRQCVVNQREVGDDTRSFNSALKHILRQDPDVILVGELRDLETISIALTAAETGHLVFATLHTQSAQDTVNRIIDVFPAEQQAQIRAQLAATLKGVVCQALLKAKDGKGRVAATEIMVINPAVATMIRRGETHQIPQALQSGGAQGMMTLNQHLAELVADGRVTREAAEEIASDAKDFDSLIAGAMARRKRPAGNSGFGM